MNMKELDNVSQTEEDNEISLIDLFAVLIKYRFLICFGTIITIALAALYLFVSTKKAGTSDKYVNIQYSYNLEVLPDAIENVFAQNLPVKSKRKTVANITEEYLSNMAVIATEIKAFNPFGSDEAELQNNDYNSFIKELFDTKKISYEISSLETALTVNIQVPEAGISKTDMMMDDIIAKINNQIESYVFPRLNSLAQNVPESLAAIQSADNSMLVLQMIEKNQILIENYKNEHESFISKNGNPFVLNDNSNDNSTNSKIKKMLIIAFAALFVFIFIAFMLNAIQNIKQDTEASGKIKSAWKDGKIKK